MKQILLIVLWITMLSCTNTNNKGQTISILEDVTDTHFLSKPNSDVILQQFSLDKDQWQSTKFRYATITSVGYNKQFEVLLEKEHALLGNELERRRLVKNFKVKIKDLLNLPKSETPLRHSSIWMPIVEELKILQKDSLNHTTLYVFTDLQENSNFFSVYKNRDLALLNNDIGKTKSIFLSRIGSFKTTNTNIKVVIVFQSKDLKQDVLFQKMLELYKLLFKKLQIPLEVKANIH